MTGSETYSCHEEAIDIQDESESECQTATEGATDEQCLAYKVSKKNESTHKCVKNTAQTEDASPCIEQLLKCNEKKSDVSDEICAKLQVDNNDQEKCIKNGEECGIIKYCNYASGVDDEACKVFPLQT